MRVQYFSKERILANKATQPFWEKAVRIRDVPTGVDMILALSYPEEKCFARELMPDEFAIEFSTPVETTPRIPQATQSRRYVQETGVRKSYLEERQNANIRVVWPTILHTTKPRVICIKDFLCLPLEPEAIGVDIPQTYYARVKHHLKRIQRFALKLNRTEKYIDVLLLTNADGKIAGLCTTTWGAK